MRDLRASLIAMSERGTPLGSRRLRERVALKLAGAGLTPEPVRGRRLRGPALAAVAAVIVLVAFGGVMWFLNRTEGETAVPTTIPVTTTLPPVSTTTSTPATTMPESTTTSLPTEAAGPTPTPIEATPPSLLMTWEATSPPSFADGNPVSLVAGGPGLIAVGSADDGYYGDGAAWVSSDGSAWTRISDNTGVFGGKQNYGLHDGRQALSDVTAWNGGFVAVGADGRGSDSPEADAAVWLSPDGVTWTRVSHQEAFGGPGSQTMAAVTAGGPGLVAVGTDDETLFDPHAAVWLSADGVTWTRVDPTAIEGEGAEEAVAGVGAGAIMTDVVPGGPGLIAVGIVDPYGYQKLPAVWVSSDGTTWDQILLDPGVTGDTRASVPNAIAAGPHGFVAVGEMSEGLIEGGNAYGQADFGYAAVWMSEDGIDWRLAAVLDAGPMDEPADCGYQAQANDAVWYEDTLLVMGNLTATCDTRDDYAMVWATADLGQTWHLIAKESVGPTPGLLGAYFGGLGVMRNVEVLGPQVVAVGAIESGIAWLGQWQVP